MKINITAIGKFEYLNNGDEKIDLEIDLLELHSSDFTLDQVITENCTQKTKVDIEEFYIIN